MDSNGIADEAGKMCSTPATHCREYVADFSNHTIRKITPGGVVTTLAGLARVQTSDSERQLLDHRRLETVEIETDAGAVPIEPSF